MAQEVRAGTLAELQSAGQLRTKVGSLPVVVFWHDGTAYAIEDRCPHLGFPLHQGTVESGLVTCHWHHARFDLVSGLHARPLGRRRARLRRRDPRRRRDRRRPPGHRCRRAPPDADCARGSRRTSRSSSPSRCSGCSTPGVEPGEIVRTGVEFGARYRDAGWGTGLTTLVAMANLIPHLDRDDRALALVHGLAAVANDTRGRAPNFPVGPLTSDGVPVDRLAQWYRRFVETRAADAAERVLETTLVDAAHVGDAEAMMFAAATDHIFVDEGHTIDFTNKAFESLAHLGRRRGPGRAPDARPPDRVRATLRGVLGVAAPARPRRAGRRDDRGAAASLGRRRRDTRHGRGRSGRGARPGSSSKTIRTRSWTRCSRRCATASTPSSSAARSRTPPRYASPASTSRTTTATGTPSTTRSRARTRCTTRSNGGRRPELLRGCVHAALRVYLDRFLNVPAARLPRAEKGDLDALAQCFEIQGGVDDAGNEAYGFLHAGGTRAELVAALGHALLVEDAGFHWYQTVEAGVRQAEQWPEGSEESALVLTAVARFLAAHTPTRRELPTVVRIATRLRRGEALYEDDDEVVSAG